MKILTILIIIFLLSSLSIADVIRQIDKDRYIDSQGNIYEIRNNIVFVNGIPENRIEYLEKSQKHQDRVYVDNSEEAGRAAGNLAAALIQLFEQEPTGNEK